MTDPAASGERKKPILSYRISGQDLAEAVERRRRSRRQSSVDTSVDEDLFRDVTPTDSSILWADSDVDSIPCSHSSVDSRQPIPPEAWRQSWRSPEEERRKRMLEQRKQQWRASKAAEVLPAALPAALPATPAATLPAGIAIRPVSIRTTDSQTSLAPPSVSSLNSGASGRSVSPRVSRRESRRCPNLDEMTPIRPPSSGELRSKSLSASIPATPARIPAKILRKPDDDVPWQGRNRPLRLPDGIRTQMLSHPVTLKKFGHHVGPSRNPDCGCVHCVEHNRVRNLQHLPR